MEEDKGYTQERQTWDPGVRNTKPARRECKDCNWAHIRLREKQVHNGIKSLESVGTEDAVSYEAQLERNGGNVEDKQSKG